MSNLTGKRFIVTGAASGIGEATARRLVDEGASVISLDRNTPAGEVDRHITVDLADPKSIDNAVAELDGTYDALLNIAGVPGTAPADLVLAVNALGMRHLTESVLDKLNPGGSVVVVSSTAGFNWPQRLDVIKELLSTESFEEGAEWFATHPQEGNAYNFSKEVATVYTLTMGVALQDMGLRINAVLPGPVETPILDDFRESMGHDTIDGVAALLGRHAAPNEIASAVVFLTSPEASWINGHALVVDGGITGTVATGLVPTPDF